MSELRFSDVLARLRPDSERRLQVTWSRRRSWPRRLAWNPASELTFSRRDPRWRSRLKRFVDEHHRRGRLLAGFFSYDLGLEKLGVQTRRRTGPNTSSDDIPDGYVAAFGNYLVGAGPPGAVRVVAEDRAFRREVTEILARPSAPRPAGPVFNRPLRPSQSRAGYGRSFRAVQRHIRDGDVYQLNLTHRLEGRSGFTPLELLRRLLTASPGSLLSVIDAGDFALISASPERFVRIVDGTITTAPIKGTRPRGRTPAADARIRRDLLASDKERAELNMITDLLRNDLGKICRADSVRVTARRRLTAHPTIWHTHSEVTGRLQSGFEPVDALLELLPGGSISGCPKRRAVEIIDGLEPVPRGPYTGTTFTLDSDGTLDSSILIRTLVRQDSRAYLSVGGGIVHGAQEAAEYQESLDKAKVFTEL